MALALDRFREGHAITCADVGFRIDLKSVPKVLRVCVETVSIHMENVTPAEAKQLIARSKDVGDTLAADEPLFAEVWSTYPKVFSVSYNYGMGGIEMATEVVGDFKWIR